MAFQPMEFEIRRRIKATVRWACALFVLQRLVWIASAIGLALLALVAADWGVRGTHAGYRWFLSAFAWSVILVGGIGWALPVVRWRLSEMQAAWLIEKSQPKLRGYLATSLSLVLHSQSGESGGLVLAALNETLDRLRDLQPYRLLKWDRLWTGTVTAGLVGGAMVTLAWVAPQLTSIGIARLVSPAEDIRWPARYLLSFEAPPAVVARGVPTPIHIVEENGELPRHVTLQVRQLDSGAFQTLDAQGGGAKVTMILPGGESEFEMRAVGADGDTGWRRVMVADPPAIQDFELRAQPPECLGLEPLSATGPLRVPEGSSLLCYGRSDQRLDSARLVMQAEGAEPQELPLQVTEDGHAFFLPQSWVLSEDLEYWVEIVADSGLRNATPRYSMTVQLNTPPMLEWGLSELDLQGEFYVVDGEVAQLELSVIDDFGLQWIAMEQTSASDDSRWNRIWEADAFSAAVNEPSRKRFLIQWVPEVLGDTDARLLRPHACDRCGLNSTGAEHRVKVVTRDGYVVAIQHAWEEWLSSLLPSRRELIALRDLAAQSQASISAGTLLEGSQVRQAVFRVSRLADEALSSAGIIHHRLVDLSQWVTRYNLATEPTGAKVLEMSQAWDEQLLPTLNEIQRLWKELERLPEERSQDQLEVVRQLLAEQEKMVEFFSKWLGQSGRGNPSQWLEQLRDVGKAQQRLMSQTEDLRTLSIVDAAAGETTAAQLSRVQVELAVTLEKLQQQIQEAVSAKVGGPPDTGLERVMETLVSQPIAVWQREAAGLLNQQQYAASLSLQRQAVNALQKFLELEQATSNGDTGRNKESWIAWLELRLAEAEGLQNELQILQHTDAEEALAKRGHELLARMRELRSQLSTVADEAGDLKPWMQPLSESAMEHVKQAERQAASNGIEESEDHLAAAASTLRQGITELMEEWEADFQSDPFERQLRSTLKRWAFLQGGIVSDLRWLSEMQNLFEEAEVREILKERQDALRQNLRQYAEAWKELPLLHWELSEVGEEMEKLSGRYADEPFLHDLVGPARRIWDRLVALAAFQSESPTNPESAEPPTIPESPSGDSQRIRRPAGWQVQLAAIRQRQIRILERTVHFAGEDLELEEFRGQVDDLRQEQERLREQTLRLGEAAAALQDPSQERPGSEEQESNRQPPGLPGLPGLGGTPQTQDPIPSNPPETEPTDGEDLGEERHPLATLETRMELVVDYFSRYDCSSVNQEIQQAIIDELSNTSSQNNPSDSSSSGDQQSSPSQAGNSVGGQAEGVDATGLLPNELMIRSGVWGHLPPELQQGIQTLWVDGWIEGYEEASIEYFQQLGRRLEVERD